MNQKQLANKVEDDEDKLFCLSLVKEMKKVPKTKRLQLKIGIYNLILQNQMTQHPPVSSTINAVPSLPSKSYPSTSRGQQYIPTNPGYPYGYGYTAASYNIHSYPPQGSYHGPTTPVQGLADTPSPAPTNTSDVSQESKLDLFTE